MIEEASLRVEGSDAQRTADLRIILDNVTAGLLVIGHDLSVGSSYSKSCHSLLGASDIAGRSVVDLIAGDDRRMRDALGLSLRQIFDDILPEEVSIDCVPRRLHVGDRVLDASIRTLRDGGGTVEKLLCTLTDATHLDEVEREARQNRLLVDILRQKETFSSFVSEMRQLLAVTRGHVLRAEIGPMRRALHTMKGNASGFELSTVVERIHAVEGRESVRLEDVTTIEIALRSFLAQHEAILGIDYDERMQDSFVVSAEAIQALRTLARGDDLSPQSIETWAAQIGMKRASDLIGPLSNYAIKLGERLGKEVDFVISGGDVLADVKSARAIFRTLSHLVRNAIDHGLEEPDERIDAGKPARGHLRLDVGESETHWTVTLHDDGRGIDAKTIAEAAVRGGFVSAAKLREMSDAEIVDLVFVEGFSTSESLSDVSGRGMGMAVIRAVLEGQNGSVRLETVAGKSTSVHLCFPKPQLVRREPELVRPDVSGPGATRKERKERKDLATSDPTKLEPLAADIVKERKEPATSASSSHEADMRNKMAASVAKASPSGDVDDRKPPKLPSNTAGAASAYQAASQHQSANGQNTISSAVQDALLGSGDSSDGI